MELSGAFSKVSDRVLERYQWDIVSQPPGAEAVLWPAADIESPSLFIPRSGEYVISLRVWDIKGVESCVPDTIVIDTEGPTQGLRVEMVGGTEVGDLDLHLLAPGGSWGEGPLDCFSGNPNPDWGETGDARDDPWLDRDAKAGDLVVESIHLARLTAPTEEDEQASYAFGVSQAGAPASSDSLVRVRVHLDGLLVLEDELPAAGWGFWEVGELALPDRIVTRTRRSYR